MASSRSRIFLLGLRMRGESMVGADPEPRMGSSGSTRVAWIAFGVYSLSFLPMGFHFFYIGFLFFLNPLFTRSQ